MKLTNTALQVVPFAFVVFASGCALPGDSPTTTMTDDEIRVADHKRVCDVAQPGEAACHARALVDRNGLVIANANPAGYSPSQLRSAYKITGSGSSSTVVAVVTAYDYATAEADLATYRSQFGLPACTSASGCFRKVDETGGTSFPGPNVSWNQEAALDLDMVSAMCPRCKLLLVEATAATFADLAAAVNE